MHYTHTRTPTTLQDPATALDSIELADLHDALADSRGANHGDLSASKKAQKAQKMKAIQTVLDQSQTRMHPLPLNESG